MEWNRGEGEGEGGTEGQACPDAEQPSWPETLAGARGEQEGSRAAPHLPWFSHSPRSLPQGPALRGPGNWTGQESPNSRTLGFSWVCGRQRTTGLTTWREKNVTTQT